MGMLFGEIIEPSTRALLNDDLVEYHEHKKNIQLEFVGNGALPPEIHTLIFAETENVRITLKKCSLLDQQPILKINNECVEVYGLKNNMYIVSLLENNELTSGQITEEFGTWIKAAKKVYAMTSNHIANYKNSDLETRPPSLIRMLSTDYENEFPLDILEPPNLITGFGAAVLTYCLHNKLLCSLYVIYIDNVPLDTVNMGPLLNLLENINVPLNNRIVNVRPNSSNLYM